MADVDTTPREPETLGTGTVEQAEAAEEPEVTQDDATKTEGGERDSPQGQQAEGGDRNSPKDQPEGGEENSADKQEEEGKEGGEKTQDPLPSRLSPDGKADDSPGSEPQTARTADAADDSGSAAPGIKAGGEEEGEGVKGEREGGGDRTPPPQKTDQAPQHTEKERGGDDEDGGAGEGADTQRAEDEHQPPATPTFSTDNDDDDRTRAEAAAVMEEESRTNVADTAGGVSTLGSAPTPSGGLPTNAKRLTTTPLEGAGLPMKPPTAQLPPVARGQVRGQQMTSAITDALKQSTQPSPKQLIRSRRPPKYIRLATVTVSPASEASPHYGTILFGRESISVRCAEEKGKKVRQKEATKVTLPSLPPPPYIRPTRVELTRAKPLPQGPSLYYEEPRRPRKVITWDEATNARPPLRIDMEGPTPCSYTPRVKPLNETNAPSFTFGARCFTEKQGGARTSFSKTWFQTPHVWHNKVDFGRDHAWPSPSHYPKGSSLGPRQRTMPEAPSFTFGHKTAYSIVKPGAPKEPSPNEYKRQLADTLVLPRGPSFTHQLRREGTTLWSAAEITPGPAAYSPNKPSPERPSFSIQGIRREKSHVLGPYSSL